MIFLPVLLFIVICTLVYLFFAPFYLEVNSRENLYRFRFHRLASVSLKMENDALILDGRIALWKKQVDIFAVKKGQKLKSGKTLNKRMQGIPIKKMLNMLKSFKVNKCYLTMDSGDMQLNGILYPFFYMISYYTGKNILINFKEENELIFEIENSLARMSWAYISS
jgi:hypothetical protein